ncbi:MAG: type 2 isopentenyl-diphosphate Delta-isomerase [Spirochaetota bacterium]|jgi:isopentenyl-diphosphate delta-isomerase type 2|nr:type 2 isopentenyl-diphosphate Delta-isomerase [Spirochaetota bacterium]
MGSRASKRNTITVRKKRHLEVCLREKNFRIEDVRGAGFGAIHFVHECLPEINADGIDTGVEFLGKKLSFPFLISCITGGTLDGSPLNISLAGAAQRARVAFGLGSMRILFHEPKAYKDFAVRSLAPDVPLLANIGAAQLAEFAPLRILEAAQSLDADALVVHLNPGQEIAQTGGDVDFRGVMDAISALIELNRLPIIIKETGHGIRPRRARDLLARGAAWVDLAGAGGTDFLQVELACREEGSPDQIANPFASWGLPTALILAALRVQRSPGDRREAMPVIASGGLRNGLDLAKSLALGAGLGGMALPLARACAERGEEGITGVLDRIHHELIMAMFLTGSRTIPSLRRADLYYDADFTALLQGLLAAEEGYAHG